MLQTSICCLKPACTRGLLFWFSLAVFKGSEKHAPRSLERLSGDSYPVTVLFKAPLATHNAAVDALQAGLFESIVCALYWATSDTVLPPGRPAALPRFATAPGTVEVPDATAAASVWQPAEGVVVDAVGARVVVSVTRGARALASALHGAINAKPFVPEGLRQRFCRIFEAVPPPSQPPAASGYLALVRGTHGMAHWVSVGGAPLVGSPHGTPELLSLSPVSPLVPASWNDPSAAVPGHPLGSLLWEVDVALPFIKRGESLEPMLPLFFQLSAAQHAALVARRDGTAVQRPRVQYVAAALQKTISDVQSLRPELDSGCPEVGHALRLLTVEGGAILEVRSCRRRPPTRQHLLRRPYRAVRRHAWTLHCSIANA